MTSSLNNSNPKAFHIFAALWVIIHLFANYVIEVNGEEAYYWLFSQNLAWGYLDHPPMIGVVTALGYEFIPNPLGMRLGMLLLSVLVMYLLRATSDTKNDKLLIWLFLGFLPVHMASYMVKPMCP